MKSANNVIKFPLTAVDLDLNKIRNEEQLHEKFLQNKKLHADLIVDAYGTQLVNRLSMHGFDTYNENFIKYFTFVIESLRVCLYDNLDINDNPITRDIDKCISKIEARETKALQILEQSLSLDHLNPDTLTDFTED